MLSNVFFQSTVFKKKIELNQTITVKGKWNRVKQEITGNRVFFNSQGTQTQENADVQLEPVYRIKEGIKQKQIRDQIRQSVK